jgi:hypothetical protein
MKLRAVGLMLLGAVSTTAVADNIDVNLREDAIRASYSMDLTSRGYNGLSADFGLLYNEDKEQLDDILAHAGLMVSGENWSKSGTFDISLGGRLVHTSPANVDLAALAFGGQVRFSPIHRVGLGGAVFYAPGITSFMDAESYTETNLRLDYQVLPQAFVYLGYRNIEVDIDGGADDAELDEGMHLGFKMLF